MRAAGRRVLLLPPLVDHLSPPGPPVQGCLEGRYIDAVAVLGHVRDLGEERDRAAQGGVERADGGDPTSIDRVGVGRRLTSSSGNARWSLSTASCRPTNSLAAVGFAVTPVGACSDVSLAALVYTSIRMRGIGRPAVSPVGRTTSP